MGALCPSFRPAVPGAPAAAPVYPDALVVFSDNTDLWWLRWLKPGFRHCFIA